MAENLGEDFFRTSGVEDFKLKNLSAPPSGYPLVRIEDPYSDEVVGDCFEDRKALLIEHIRNNPGVDTVKGFFYELIRIEQGITPIYEEALFKALEYIDGRWDCADFAISGMMRLYKQLGDSPLVSEALLQKIKETILGFKYWPDEPGTDSMCYWTENHHIIFSAAEYLAGLWFPDEVFTNSGITGAQKQKKAMKRIYKWLELRFYTGFNEWLSNVYFDEDFLPLLNLLDFSDDEEMKRQCGQILDLMLYDMALNSYKGIFSCTHGRTYTKEKLYPKKESTIDTAKLMFGLGRFANEDNMSAVIFALSDYRMPKVIEAIAQNIKDEEWVNKQRVSIKLKDKAEWGYGSLDLESAMGLLSFGGYSHPHTFNHLALMLDEFNWWDNKFFQEFKPFKKLIQYGRHIGLTNLVAGVMQKDMSRNSFEESHIYTYRTPDYMLSTSQNYRPGFGGDQHHLWQATLDNSCVVFTTHPGGYGETAPDAYWHGSGFMPKSIQHKNVNISIYNTPLMPTVVLQEILDFTHAFFPKERFSLVVEKNDWVFGKSNDGYVAIRSKNGYKWQSKGDYAGQEIIAEGKQNIWITEMGRKATHGSFETFIETIAGSEVKFDDLAVTYKSQYAGRIQTGWKKPLRVNGNYVPTNDYKRYDNITSQTSMKDRKISIEFAGYEHTMHL